MMTNLSTTLDQHLCAVSDRMDSAIGRNKQARSAIECRMNTDDFLVATAQHLGALADVVLPAARRLPDDRVLARDLLIATKRLERALVVLKAKQYGQAQTVRRTWAEVWNRVRQGLDEVATIERRIVDELATSVPPDELDRLSRRLTDVARRSPTRSHPNLPHRGVAGRVVRSVWGRADRVWDELEGRVARPLPPAEAS